jgi:hypothetical protein
LSGKRVRYLSVPYSSVRSFSVASAGKVDADQELVLHCRGLGRVSFDFDSDVDACAVYRFLGASILGVEGAVGYDASALVGDFSSVVGTAGGGGGGSLPSLLLDVLGSDYGRMDEGEVGSRLRCVLLEDERVEMAFGCGRDTFVLTSHRLLRVNVQGATGTKGECVRALTVEAADGVISTTPVIISASHPSRLLSPVEILTVEYLAILWSTIKGYSSESCEMIDLLLSSSYSFSLLASLLPNISRHMFAFQSRLPGDSLIGTASWSSSSISRMW